MFELFFAQLWVSILAAAGRAAVSGLFGRSLGDLGTSWGALGCSWAAKNALNVLSFFVNKS